MKQVLLADRSNEYLEGRARKPLPPILLWMGDSVEIGDAYLFRGRAFVVDAIYTTKLSASGVHCQRTEYPKKNLSTGLSVDRRGGESTGVPGAPMSH